MKESHENTELAPSHYSRCFCSPSLIPRQRRSDGQKLFDTNCAKCHGPDGSGNTVVGKAVGAKDLGSAEAKKLTDAEIHTQIDQGKGNMPPFGGTLNKAQIDSLIPIVREFGKKKAAGQETKLRSLFRRPLH